MFRTAISAAFAFVVLTGASSAVEAQRPRAPQPPAERERNSRQQGEREQGERERSDPRIPRQYMPPPGMCRIWLDDVPPNQQPAPTDCPTAIRKRPSNGRVIFGERKGDRERSEVELRRDLRGRTPPVRIRIPPIF